MYIFPVNSGLREDIASEEMNERGQTLNQLLEGRVDSDSEDDEETNSLLLPISRFELSRCFLK